MTNEQTTLEGKTMNKPKPLRIGDYVTIADVSMEIKSRNAFKIKYIKASSWVPAGDDLKTEYFYNLVSPDGTGWYRENAVELFNRKEKEF